MADNVIGMTETLRPVPEGYTTVTSWLITKNTAGLIDFLIAAFGAAEIDRVLNEDGSIGHAEVRIGDAIVMMFDAKPHWPETPSFLRLYVADAEATYRQALAAGATSVTEPTELFWGDRVGRVRDPFGNVWWLQDRVAELDHEEIASRAQRPEYLEAMRYVQSAEIVLPV